jgi:hypothetical protein
LDFKNPTLTIVGMKPPKKPVVQDPVRQLIAKVIDDNNLDMKALSKQLGRNDAYLFQFLKQGVPRKLDEDDRRSLAVLLGVDEDLLRLSGKPQLSTENSSNTAGLRKRTSGPVESSSRLEANVGTRGPAPDLGDWPRDLPVRGTALCGDQDRGDFRFNGEVVDRIRRPPRLSGVKDAFVVYLTGDSMEPRYKPGEPAYIHPGQPPRVGDEVLVELHPERDGEAGAAMVKILVARTATKLRLSQYNPPNTRIELDIRRVKNVYRVVPHGELLNS